jgi:integrase
LPTFEKYARQWLKLPTDRKPTTIEVYERSLECHVFPEIGRMPIDEIKKPQLQALFDDLAIDGYGKSTIKIIKAPVSLIFDHAVEGGLIPDNPTHKLKVEGRQARKPNDPLNEVEAERLLEQAKQYEGGEYYLLFLYALRTGKRIGEMLATTWKDINFEKRFVEVKRNLVRGQLYRPKNSRNRRVGLSPLMIEELRKLRTQQKRQALKSGHAVPKFVFTDENGEIMRQHKIREALEKCLEAAKLHRITIHDLRHSYAHIRLSRGHNLADVSRSLGHADIKITVKIYGHLKHDDFQDEIDSLDTPHLTAPHAQPADADN